MMRYNSLFWYACGMVTAVLALGVVMNGGHKHVRVRAPPGCKQGWYDIFAGEGDVAESGCGCEPGAGSDGSFVPNPTLCRGSWEVPGALVHAIIVTVAGAWGLPFLPALCTMLQFGPSHRWGWRLVLYAAVVLLRTYVLYLGLGAIQDAIQGPEGSNCSYSHLRRKNLCRDNFDFSDHVVLMVMHFVAIPVIELYAALHELPNRPPLATGLREVGLTSVCTAMFVATTCSVLFLTAAFFHSPIETITGMIVCMMGLGVPAFLVSQSTVAGLPMLQLFVRPRPPGSPPVSPTRASESMGLGRTPSLESGRGI